MTNKITKTFKRKRLKRAFNSDLKAMPQTNEGVINIHRMDTLNAGDLYCAPHHYFKELKGTGRDIFNYKREEGSLRADFINDISKNALIVGGGGLLNRNGFKLQMKAFEGLAQRNKKTVLWGVGHNEKSAKTYGKVTEYTINVDHFGLVGTRDYSMPGEYVPCVSCMHPLLDKKYTETQEYGIILHKDTVKKPKIVALFDTYPTTSNTTDIEAIIKFIGASQKIVTDSYHAMYWSILLGKKVVVIPNSSKFYDFKHRPVISTFEEAIGAFAKAQTFPDLLLECRNINRNFANKAFDYLNL